MPQFGFGPQPPQSMQDAPGPSQLMKLLGFSQGGVDIADRPGSSPRDIPMPQPRPAEAPSPMGFFQRNAYLQKDQESGEYLDPTFAAKANASSGNDIIKSMLASFMGGG
jgi:hypothetical protein